MSGFRAAFLFCGQFWRVQNSVPTWEISERSFDGIGLRVAIPLSNREGAVPGDVPQREGFAAGLGKHG